MTLAKWLHHLFDPHCTRCAEDLAESKVCDSCETLKIQLSIANHEKEQMLTSILELIGPEEQTPVPHQDFKEVKPKMMTWNIRKNMLEAEDRKTAELLAAKKKSISEQIKDLEHEVGISNSDKEVS